MRTQMCRAILLLMCGLVAGFRGMAIADEIDDEVTALNGTYGMWINGVVQLVDLPADAKPEEVVKRVVANAAPWCRDQINGDQFHDWHIVKFRNVLIRDIGPNGETYTAVLVESARGSRSIILLRYMGNHPIDTTPPNVDLPQTSLQLRPNAVINQKLSPPPSGDAGGTLHGWWNRIFFVTTAP